MMLDEWHLHDPVLPQKDTKQGLHSPLPAGLLSEFHLACASTESCTGVVTETACCWTMHPPQCVFYPYCLLALMGNPGLVALAGGSSALLL